MIDNLEIAFKRGYLSLEDGDFDKANDFFEAGLNCNPESIEAYIGKLLSELKVKSESELVSCPEPFFNSPNYKKILSFGSEDVAFKFVNYNNEIIYRSAFKKMQIAKSPSEFISASKIFANISSYKNSNELQLECENKAKYYEAFRLEKVDSPDSLNQAIEIYSALSGFADSTDRICICKSRIKTLAEIAKQELIKCEKEKKFQAEQHKRRTRSIIITSATILSIIAITTVVILLVKLVYIPSSKYNKAINLFHEQSFDNAIVLFEELGDYKDSKQQIELCKNAKIESIYQQACEDLANKNYQDAITSFHNLGNHKDSNDKYLEANYLLAEQYIKNNEPYLAAITFSNAIGYKDAEERCYSLWNNFFLTEVIAVDETNAMAVKKDGTIISVGFDKDDSPNIWSNVKSVSLGGDLGIALKNDSSIVYVGKDVADRIDSDKIVGTNCNEWTNITQAATSNGRVIGLLKDGKVTDRGWNVNNTCGVFGWSDVIFVDAAPSYTVAIKEDRSVLITRELSYVNDTSSFTDIVKVSAGESHLIGLRANGRVVAHGDNDLKQSEVTNWRNIIDIATGSEHTVGLKYDGTVIATGNNNRGQCNVENWSDVIAVYAGYESTIGLKSDGSILVTGFIKDLYASINDWDNIKIEYR